MAAVGHTPPDAMLADPAYATVVIRTELRRRGINTVIPDQRDRMAARKRRGSKRGRPPGLEAVAYKGAQRRALLWPAKQWRGIAARYDKGAITYRRHSLRHLYVGSAPERCALTIDTVG